MERLLLGHFARHGRPSTRSELAELAELVSDNTDEFEHVLAALVESQRVLTRRFALEEGEETLEVCFWPPHPPPNSIRARPPAPKPEDGPPPELLALRRQREALQREVDELAASLPAEVDIEAFIQAHIKRLHDYNEIKDIGQMLLGKCAERQQTTTKAMYSQYGLDLED